MINYVHWTGYCNVVVLFLSPTECPGGVETPCGGRGHCEVNIALGNPGVTVNGPYSHNTSHG